MTIPSALSTSASLTPARTRALSIATIVGVLTATLVLGVAAPAQAALPPAQAVLGMTGSRPSATQIPFSISDQVSAAEDVATGNLTVSNSTEECYVAAAGAIFSTGLAVISIATAPVTPGGGFAIAAGFGGVAFASYGVLSSCQ